ncbi:MAG: AAA family ATPase, partial [Nanoarchaeota archaeon]
MYIERDIEGNVKKWLDNREILIVRGPRQSGKTTLLKKLKEHLQKNGIAETNINYLTFEDDLARMKFEDDPKNFIQSRLREGKTFFLFDEVQYVNDAGKKLKLIFDIYENIKIIVTGSSSFDLTTLGKYLVGRAIFFDLLPFSFSEFLQSKGENYRREYERVRYKFGVNVLPEKQPFLEEFNTFLHEYLTYGAYPSIVLEKDTEKKKELLKNFFITYIEKDVVVRYGMKYREKVVLVLKALSASLGNILNYGTLTNITGLNYVELKEILSILEDS